MFSAFKVSKKEGGRYDLDQLFKGLESVLWERGNVGQSGGIQDNDFPASEKDHFLLIEI